MEWNRQNFFYRPATEIRGSRVGSASDVSPGQHVDCVIHDAIYHARQNAGLEFKKPQWCGTRVWQKGPARIQTSRCVTHILHFFSYWDGLGCKVGGEEGSWARGSH